MYYSSPLKKAKLIKRYKRFLADCELPGGDVTTVYCPNTGAMTHCADPGTYIWYSRSDNPKRKYTLTWEQATDSWGHRVGVHSSLANHLVAEALESGCLARLECMSLRDAQSAWLSDIKHIQPEHKIPDLNVRLDFLVQTNQADVFVEVKSVTLHQSEGLGRFPDAVTARGLKQIRALQTLLSQGKRAMLVYCVQNSGIDRFELAHDIDPTYASAVCKFHESGGRILIVGTELSARENTITHYIPWMTS